MNNETELGEITNHEIERRVAALENQVAKSQADWQTLHDQMVTLLGKSAGLRAGWLYLMAFIAAMGTLISIFHIMAS